MILNPCLVVRGDVSADEPELAVTDVRERALELRAALPKRLDLRADENDPRLDALEQVVLVPCLSVLRDHLVVGRHRAPTATREIHARSSARNVGSIACGSGYSRYSTVAPACSSSSRALRPNSSGIIGSRIPWPIATGGMSVRSSSKPSTVGMKLESAMVAAGRGRPAPRLKEYAITPPCEKPPSKVWSYGIPRSSRKPSSHAPTFS